MKIPCFHLVGLSLVFKAFCTYKFSSCTTKMAIFAAMGPADKKLEVAAGNRATFDDDVTTFRRAPPCALLRASIKIFWALTPPRRQAKTRVACGRTGRNKEVRRPKYQFCRVMTVSHNLAAPCRAACERVGTKLYCHRARGVAVSTKMY